MSSYRLIQVAVPAGSVRHSRGKALLNEHMQTNAEIHNGLCPQLLLSPNYCMWNEFRAKKTKKHISDAVFNFVVSLGKMMNPFHNRAFVGLQFCMLWVPGVILAQKSLQLDFIWRYWPAAGNSRTESSYNCNTICTISNSEHVIITGYFVGSLPC